MLLNFVIWSAAAAAAADAADAAAAAATAACLPPTFLSSLTLTTPAIQCVICHRLAPCQESPMTQEARRIQGRNEGGKEWGKEGGRP